MHRKAAIRLLNQSGHVQVQRERRGRPRKDGPEVVAALAQIWEAGDRMSGKLLAAVMPELLGALERHGELDLAEEVKQRLCEMSAAAIDRRPQRYSSSMPACGAARPSRSAPAMVSALLPYP
jgi:hypothetical protein